MDPLSLLQPSSESTWLSAARSKRAFFARPLPSSPCPLIDSPVSSSQTP